MFHKEYGFLAQQFYIGALTLTLVKNMCASLASVVWYETNPIVFAPIVNKDIVMQLTLLHGLYNEFGVWHVT
jgi:hypothetical protein